MPASPVGQKQKLDEGKRFLDSRACADATGGAWGSSVH